MRVGVCGWGRGASVCRAPGLPVVCRTGEVQVHKSEWLTPLAGGLAKTCLLAFYYAIYYAILFFTTLFTTLREAPANDLYVFWHVPKRQYGLKGPGID